MKEKNKLLPWRFRWLIAIDLDGTLLKTNSKYGNFSIHRENVKVIKELISYGHKVAILTGRPWNNTKKIYTELDLETIVGNYNGAYITNPIDSAFSDIKTKLNRKLIFELMNNQILKKTLINVIVQYDNSSLILNDQDKEMKDKFHILDHQKVKEMKSLRDIKEYNENPYTLVLKVSKSKDIDYADIINILKRKYASCFSFRYWSRTGPAQKEHIDESTLYLEINSLGANKAIALRQIAAYYNFPMRRTISFGDGINDIEMLSTAAYGVAMKNATEIVKSYAHDVTDYTNDEGGVGKFLKSFFRYDYEFIKFNGYKKNKNDSSKSSKK